MHGVPYSSAWKVNVSLRQQSIIILDNINNNDDDDVDDMVARHAPGGNMQNSD